MDIQEGLKHLSSVDDKMRKLIKTFPSPTFESDENNFSSLVKYIIYQQLSSRSASAIFDRYKRLLKNKKHKNPINVLSIDSDKLKSIGLSKQKVLYIKSIAKAFINKDIPNDFSNLSNHDINKILIKTKGIGHWTINMFLMFTLKREDIMPFSDLGIQKGFVKYYNLKFPPTIEFMKLKSELWKPFRTIASLYLWNLVDDDFKW